MILCYSPKDKIFKKMNLLFFDGFKLLSYEVPLTYNPDDLICVIFAKKR